MVRIKMALLRTLRFQADLTDFLLANVIFYFCVSFAYHEVLTRTEHVLKLNKPLFFVRVACLLYFITVMKIKISSLYILKSVFLQYT